MKKNNLIHYITLNALVASLYVAISLLLLPISFGTNGIIDIRISEIFMVLSMFSLKYFPGLIVGCFITNLFSGFIVDLIVGTLQTIISCFVMYFFRKKPQIAIILSSIICGIMVGLELYLLGFSSIGLFILLTVFIGELISLEIGYFVIYLPFIKKHKNFLN